MKAILIKICLLVFIININGQSKEQLLSCQNTNQNITIERIERLGEIYKITNRLSGKTYYLNFNNYKAVRTINTNQVDTTVIYPDLVDTTQFNGMYEFWTSVPVGSFGPEVIIIGDVNVNERSELYGARYNSYTHINERSMYEYNTDLETFEFRTDMPWDSLGDYSSFKQIYDVNQDGEQNVFITGNQPDTDTLSGIKVARTLGLNDTTNLPTDIVFDYKQWNQMNDPLWGEYDNREGTDLFYCTDGNDLAVAAARYDKNTNSAETVYYYEVPEDIFYLAGLTNQDIDGDGYADLSTGGLYGDIVIFEYDEIIQNYRDVWHGDGGTYNVYIHFNTNDIDGNGKKEVWAGGSAFYNNAPITRLSCLEAIGNNQYETKHVIDIVGRFPFDAYNGFSVDIDNDGTEEIGLCLDQTFMIFKFTGVENEWSFELFYLKLNNIENSQYFGATMYDLDADGFDELLVMMDDDPPGLGSIILLTRIYKPTDLVSVEDNEPTVNSYNILQNYPNPFNPITNINFEVPKRTHIELSVYDIQGSLIEVITNREYLQGNYTISFDGSNLSSGIYFYQLKTPIKVYTKKMILIK